MPSHSHPPDDSSWRAIAQAMRSAAVYLDGSGAVTHGNEAARTLLGEGLVGDNLTLLLLRLRPLDPVSGRILEASELPHEMALLQRQTVHVHIRIEHDEGETIWLHVTARPSDGLEGVAVILRDVTARVLAERKIRLRERALANASEGITIADATLPDMPLIYVNDGFTRMTGFTAEEVLGRNCRFLQGEADNDAERDVIRSALREGRRCTVELRNFRKDGSLFYNRLAIAPVQDDGGRTTHFVGIQSDITERVETQQALQTANDSLRRDLVAAARVQRALLPPERIAVPGMSVAWHLQACEHLAGDSLNIMALDERHWIVYVLDVVGHGTASALLSVAVTHALNPSSPSDSLTMRTHGVGREPASPADVLSRLNRLFPWDDESGQFFTLIYGVLDTEAGRFRFATAGHPGALHLGADGNHCFVSGKGLPIGVGEETYAEKVIDLARGDGLLLFSDGVVETMDGDRRLFGQARLARHLTQDKDRPPAASLAALASALNQFRGSDSPEDDLSMVLLRREV